MSQSQDQSAYQSQYPSQQQWQQPPPLPVQSLAYSPPVQDLWANVVRFVAIAATAFAALQLFSTSTQFAMMFASQRNLTGVTLNFADYHNVVGVAFELITVVAAVLVLAGALGRQAMRPSARMLMLVGLGMLLGIDAAQWLWRTINTLSGPGSFTQMLGGPRGVALYVAYTCAFMLLRALLPALLIWVLTRQAVRQQYESSLSMG